MKRKRERKKKAQTKGTKKTAINPEEALKQNQILEK